MRNSNAPLYLLEGAVWQLPAVHQLLAALDERHLARQQCVLWGGEKGRRAQRQLQRAERHLQTVQSALLESLRALPDVSGGEALRDLEAAWESNLIRSALLPTPHSTP